MNLPKYLYGIHDEYHRKSTHGINITDSLAHFVSKTLQI